MRKPCCDKQYTNKGAWSKQEDQKLVDYIQKHGQGCWSTLPQAAGLLRCGKSCRMRWINYLRPDLKRGRFEEDEEDLIIKLHALLGNRWSLIAGRLPGRTSNEVKNYWNSYLKRKLENKGIDPNNHRLGNDFLRSRDSQKYAGETLSGLRSNTEPEIGKHQVDNESKSDAGSCMEKGPFCLRDLNLDITLSNQSHSIATEEGTQESTHESFTSRELELVYSPTLLLFK